MHISLSRVPCDSIHPFVQQLGAIIYHQAAHTPLRQHTNMAQSLQLILVAVLGFVCMAAAQEGLPVTYAQLKPTRGQWNISIATTSGSDKAVFVPVGECNTTDLSAPCLQPPMSGEKGDKVQLKFSLKDPQLKTAEDLPVKQLQFRACYATPFTANRPWRKANAIVINDRSCPAFVKVVDPDPSGEYTVEWKVPKNATAAAWYAAVFTTCQNGTQTSYCGIDSTVNATYFATTKINSTPVGMQIATAVCASIGPLFLTGYFMKDFFAQRKKA